MQASTLLGKGCFFDLAPLVPETTHQLGGAGMVCRNARPIMPEIKLPALKEIAEQGRFSLCTLRLGPCCFLMVYIIYGWTNGNVDDQAANCTDALWSLILQDSGLQPPGPKLYVGDYSASLKRLPTLYGEIQDNKLVNVGGIASAYGGKDDDYTCIANNTSKSFIF